MSDATVLLALKQCDFISQEKKWEKSFRNESRKVITIKQFEYQKFGTVSRNFQIPKRFNLTLPSKF